MTNAPHLRLVSAFSDEAYPYYMFKRLEDPYNSTERSLAIERFRHAAHVAGISDYKILEAGDQIQMNLCTSRDFQRASVAVQPGNMAAMMAQYDASISHRIIRKRCRLVSDKLDEIMPGRISFMHDTEDRTVIMNGQNKASYFAAEKLSPLIFIIGGTRL